VINKPGWLVCLVLVSFGCMICFGGCGTSNTPTESGDSISPNLSSSPNADSLSSTVPPSPASASAKEAVITYSGKMTSSIGNATPASGRVFLIISLSAENHGNSSFSVDPLYFGLVAGNQKYTAYSNTSSLDTILKHADLLDGMSAAGDIVYEVPAETSDYSLEFLGMSLQTIRWVKQ